MSKFKQKWSNTKKTEKVYIIFITSAFLFVTILWGNLIMVKTNKYKAYIAPPKKSVNKEINIPINDLINQNEGLEYKEKIMEFYNILEEALPNIEKSFLKSNIEGLVIEEDKNTKKYAFYQRAFNKIKYKDLSSIKYEDYILFHEFLHSITTSRKQVFGLNFEPNSGLEQRNRSGEIGKSLNEGILELLTNEVYGLPITRIYPTEVVSARMLCDLVGTETVLKATFSSNLSLVAETVEANCGIDSKKEFAKLTRLLDNYHKLTKKEELSEKEVAKAKQMKSNIGIGFTKLFFDKIEKDIEKNVSAENIVEEISKFQKNIRMFSFYEDCELGGKTNDSEREYFSERKEKVREKNLKRSKLFKRAFERI